MKTEYVIFCGDCVVALVYSNQEYGKIIVFREMPTNFDVPLLVHSLGDIEVENERKESIAELIMQVIPR